jgi:SAM-dependent methyltransferase
MTLSNSLITGGHTVLGVTAPGTVWYFAEGYTARGFDEYLAIMNPNETAANVRITYYLGQGAPVVKTLTAPANARTTVAVHEMAQGVGRGQAVSAKVESLNGVGLVVERSMYFTYQPEIDSPYTAADDMVPPEEMVFVGKGDFRSVGTWFVQRFIDLCDLQPHAHVLDVGCGIGRIAAPLTKHLGDEGRYEGFDIVPAGIAWCQERITARFPNFRFQLADIYNAEYNPTGRCQAAQFAFPYPDNTFDFAFATSVFTHMLPADVQHYQAEIARVLKPGGQCLCTFFLLTDTTLRLLAEGRSAYDLTIDAGDYRTVDREKPERVVALPLALVDGGFQRHGMRIVRPIRFGTWSGRESGLSHQDIVIAVKEAGPDR